MRKFAICICKTKGVDQLRGNHAADQRLCFGYVDFNNPSTSLIRNFMPLAIFCGCTTWFVSDRSETPKTGFLTTRLIYSGSEQHAGQTALNGTNRFPLAIPQF